MRDIVKLGVTLLLITAVAAGALAYVNDITEESIARQQKILLEEGLQGAFPDAGEFKNDTSKVKKYLRIVGFPDVEGFYSAYKDGRSVGTVVVVAPTGYSSKIVTMVGISDDGVIQGVKVISQTETPGLGTRVTREEFRRGFLGKRIGAPVKLNKDGGDIQALTGATVSSRAVTRGVDEALRLFDTVRKGTEKE